MRSEVRRRFSLIVHGSLLVAMASGCASKVASLTIFSTRNVDLSAAHDRLPRTERTDRRLWLLFLPLGGPPSGLLAAEEILDETNADYLTNVEVKEGGWTILAISGGWVEVAADPWRARSRLKSDPSDAPAK